MAALLLGDRINARQALGMVVSLLGNRPHRRRPGRWPSACFGDLLSLLFDALVWALLLSVIGRLAMRTRSALAATGAAFMLAVPILVVPAAWEWTRQPPTWTPTLALTVLYIGVFPGALALLAWNSGIRRLGPGRAMAFYNTLPLYVAILAVVFLSEPLRWTSLVGGALVIGGGLFAAREAPGRGK
ncbi:MAG: DMT family transporter [Anaerolineae bacterium]|nr:DMT family transporter [Anaerolineae bacterium]